MEYWVLNKQQSTSINFPKSVKSGTWLTSENKQVKLTSENKKVKLTSENKKVKLTSENKKVKLTSENKGPFVLVGAKDCPLWLCRGIANVVHQVLQSIFVGQQNTSRNLHSIFDRQQKTSRNLIRFPDPLFGATVGEPDVKMNLPLLGACQWTSALRGSVKKRIT